MQRVNSTKHDRSPWVVAMRKGHIEARPYIPGESLDGISVSKEDTPMEGGFICRNPGNGRDLWYVNEDYFHAHYEVP